MANLPVDERPIGAVKETEEDLQAVPIPDREPVTPRTGRPPIPPTPGADGAGLDPRATNPYVSLHPDIQNKTFMAKLWFEIAAHPASTDFERALAHAHYDELEPQEVKDERKAKAQEAKGNKQDKPKTKKEDK